MPTQVQKIDRTSPLIRYEGFHFNGPHHDLDCISCSATLQLTGTAMQVSVSLTCDLGNNSTNKSRGKPNAPSCPTVQLNNPNNSSPMTLIATDNHVVTFDTNTTQIQGPLNLIFTGEHVFINSFNWTSNVNSLKDIRIQDDEPAFQYEPKESWSTDMTDFPGFDDGNGHSTNQSNVNVTFSFKGDRVALYGAVGPQGGEYTTRLDDGPLQTLTEQRNFTKGFLPNQLIFYADGLDPGNHTVVLNSASSSPRVFTVDYAIVDGDANPSSVPTSTQIVPSPGPTITITSGPSSINSSSRHPRLTKAQLIGIIAGTGAFIILLILALAYILYSRHVRRKKATRAQESFNDFKFPPPHPVGAIDAFTLPKPAEIERISTRYFEPERARSFYSQSSATLDDSEGYQAEMSGKHKIESCTYARDSRGYLSVEGRDRRQSVYRDADNSSEVGAIYAI